MSFKKIILKMHGWLGLAVGLLVVFLGITGCILVFQKEIETITNPYQYVKPARKEYLLPSQLKNIAALELPGKQAHSIIYGEGNKAAQLVFYSEAPQYYYIVYIDPYTGRVLKIKNMDRDFFRVVTMGHYYLWLPPHIGQPVMASATLVFLIMMITGLILWWPKNKAARKQRFSIRWNVKWRRKNYDLHNVLGFYMTWVAIFIAITGLVMGFQWFAKAMYWTTSGGDPLVQYYEPSSDTLKNKTAMVSPVDQVWKLMKAEYTDAQIIEVHYPETKNAVIAAGANPDAGTYWQTDYRYFDQYSLKEINVKHLFGRYPGASVADKIARMNYDLHIGAIGGLPTKILAFFASLIAASLPVTGFYIWWGRRKKKNNTKASYQQAANLVKEKSDKNSWLQPN